MESSSEGSTEGPAMWPQVSEWKKTFHGHAHLFQSVWIQFYVIDELALARLICPGTFYRKQPLSKWSVRKAQKTTFKRSETLRALRMCLGTNFSVGRGIGSYAGHKAFQCCDVCLLSRLLSPKQDHPQAGVLSATGSGNGYCAQVPEPRC